MLTAFRGLFGCYFGPGGDRVGRPVQVAACVWPWEVAAKPPARRGSWWAKRNENESGPIVLQQAVAHRSSFGRPTALAPRRVRLQLRRQPRHQGQPCRRVAERSRAR